MPTTPKKPKPIIPEQHKHLEQLLSQISLKPRDMQAMDSFGPALVLWKAAEEYAELSAKLNKAAREILLYDNIQKRTTVDLAKELVDAEYLRKQMLIKLNYFDELVDIVSKLVYVMNETNPVHDEYQQAFNQNIDSVKKRDEFDMEVKK